MDNVKKMAEVLNSSETNCKNVYHTELKKFPVTFANALRRILLTDIPTVVIRDVQILENTTQLPHEMLKHRVEMLPVDVRPTDASTIRDAKIELRVLPQAEGTRTIRTNDFTMESSRPTILMTDRDTNAPLLFLRVRPSESVHIKGKLAVETKTASQVCTATTSWHVDPVRAKEDKRIFVDENAGSPAVFDNFYIQRSYSRDDRGRPDWIDLDVESVGVIPSKELVKMAVQILRKMVGDYIKEATSNIEKQKDNEYRIQIDQGGHTVCALLQEVIYSGTDVGFVSYDIPHPLRTDTVLRFHTSKTPESVLTTAQTIVEEYCGIVEKSL
jgi:DNA-directed RNA polymerase alpha subunit